MRRTLLLFSLVAAVVLACGGVALAQQTERTTPSSERQSTTSDDATPPKTPTEKIAGQYIVVFNDNVRNPRQKAQEKARAHGAEVLHTYEHALKGFAARLSAERAEALEDDPDVDYVEQDQVVSIIAQEEDQKESEEASGEKRDDAKKDAKPNAKPGGGSSVSGQTLPWGIDKVDADVSSTKAGDGTGTISNVNVYIIDTGVDNSHTDLNVVNHVNFAAGPNSDCHGHGTHVAGTASARDNSADVVGVGDGAPITGVKVLGCSGSGSWSGVIEGVDWVTANAKKPAIANMSLGGGASKAVDDAVTNSANSGVFYALAAGNDGADACNYSPARAGAGTNNGIMTVAATNDGDKEASWSNYGSCVDIWAPGVKILSTKRGGGTTTMSGTSMASPHGGGGGALYLSSKTADSPSAVEEALKNAATNTDYKSKDGRTITREYVGGF